MTMLHPTRAPLLPPTRLAPFRVLFAVIGLFAAAMATGAAFAAWSANGPALLNALSASGLAWCL